RLDEPGSPRERLCRAGRQGRAPPASPVAYAAGRRRQARRGAPDAALAGSDLGLFRAGRLERQLGLRNDIGRDGGAPLPERQAARRLVEPDRRDVAGRCGPAAVRRGLGGGARLRPDERARCRHAADRHGSLAEPDRGRRARRDRRGQRQRPRHVGNLRHLQPPGMRRVLVAAALATAAVSIAAASARSDAQHLVGVARFTAPVYATVAPGQPGNLYVVEQAGKIRVLVGGRIRPVPFLDITRRVLSGGEQGLLSVAFDPKYQQTHRFYVDYTDKNGDTRVVQYRS